MELKISFDAMGRTARWALRIHDVAADKAFCHPLVFDVHPARLSPLRITIAGIILSGAKCNYSCDYSLPTAFMDALRTLGVRVSASDQEKIDEPEIMVTELAVHTGVKLPSQTPGLDNALLVLLPSERFQGRLKGVKELLVASNAPWLSKVHGPRVVLAAAVLFSSDLLAKQIVVPALGDEPDFEYYVKLLDLVGLQLASEPKREPND